MTLTTLARFSITNLLQIALREVGLLVTWHKKPVRHTFHIDHLGQMIKVRSGGRDTAQGPH